MGMPHRNHVTRVITRRPDQNHHSAVKEACGYKSCLATLAAVGLSRELAAHQHGPGVGEIESSLLQGQGALGFIPTQGPGHYVPPLIENFKADGVWPWSSLAGLQRRREFQRLIGQHFRPFLLAGRRFHRDAGFARTDVHVQMENHLAAAPYLKHL
jgi:hypothetical protein